VAGRPERARAASGVGPRGSTGAAPRGQVKVIVGGAPVSAEWTAEIGADAYGANASLGVEKCKELMG
jgi:hypothetical protein